MDFRSSIIMFNFFAHVRDILPLTLQVSEPCKKMIQLFVVSAVIFMSHKKPAEKMLRNMLSEHSDYSESKFSYFEFWNQM